MLPFYNHNVPDFEMVYLAHYLDRIANSEDIRKPISKTFWLDKFQNKQVLHNITGVVEYVIEELDENENTPLPTKRKAKSKPSLIKDTIKKSMLDEFSTPLLHKLSFYSSSRQDKLMKINKQSFCPEVSSYKLNPSEGDMSQNAPEILSTCRSFPSLQPCSSCPSLSSPSSCSDDSFEGPSDFSM